MKSKKDYISMLNDLGNSLSREEWIIGGKDRYTGRDNYGVMLKRYDPIAWEALIVMKVIWMGFLGVLVMRNFMFASQYLFMRQHEISKKDLPCTLLK